MDEQGGACKDMLCVAGCQACRFVARDIQSTPDNGCVRHGNFGSATTLSFDFTFSTSTTNILDLTNAANNTGVF